MNDKISGSAPPSSQILMRIPAVARGRLQGVGYRYFVTGCARRAGVCGFVKNMPEGTVLMVAEGEEETLKVFLTLVRASDEPISRIDDIRKKGAGR